MAANYGETNVTGTKWLRSFRVQIDNPYGEMPKAIFHEEECIVLGNEIIKRPKGQLMINFNPSELIPLINPFTGDPLLDANNQQLYTSHMELYILLHSLYIVTATARDNT